MKNVQPRLLYCQIVKLAGLCRVTKVCFRRLRLHALAFSRRINKGGKNIFICKKFFCFKEPLYLYFSRL
jgi:hypothetical protein